MGKKKPRVKLPKYTKPNTNVKSRTDSGKKSSGKKRPGQSKPSISSDDIENVTKPVFASRMGPTKYNRLQKELQKSNSKKNSTASSIGPRRSDQSQDEGSISTRKSLSNSSRGSRPSRSSKGSKGGNKTRERRQDKDEEKEVRDKDDKDKKDKKPKPKEETEESPKIEKRVSLKPQPPKKDILRAPVPEDGSLHLFEPVVTTRKMWLELSRNNLGMFSKTQYEYNVFSTKKVRMCTVRPAVGEGSESFRATEKPKAFAVQVQQGSPDLFFMSYKLGNFFKRTIKIDLRMTQERVGQIQQVSRNLIVTDVSGQEVMRVNDVPLLGCCNQVGPDHFKCDVYLTGGGITNPLGVLGRNGSTMEHTVTGEPNGFYFVAKKTSLPENFRHMHLLYILSILVPMMTIYAD